MLQKPLWQRVSDTDGAAFTRSLQAIFKDRDSASVLNEAQTESEIIAPVLDVLGWGSATSGKRREDVPDWLLFASPEAEDKALPLRDDQRPRHGIGLLETKRWLRPLDRGDASEPQDPDAPSSQMLRYLSRAAFLPQDWDSAGRSLHAYALNEARLYEEQVAQDLGRRVFNEVFPQLADALTRADLAAQTHSVGYGQFTRPQFTRAYLDEVREAALVLLYRLLFLFYAEDRMLLPVRDARYAEYSVRQIREEVRDKVDAGGTFSSTMPKIWLALQGVFQLIDQGDDDIGMPAYNGGLFDRARSALLVRTRVADKVMAPIIDALSRRTKEVARGWINYRDLSVSHLGGIYERLLEYTLVHKVQALDTYKDRDEIDEIAAQPASFARKVSGNYYTHDDLVRLVLRESVGLLASERMQAFEAQLARWRKKHALNPGDWDALDAADPASALLELKICDPAMGSGHFLVTLVDFLADRVLEAINTASEQVNAQPWAAHLMESGRPWQSPVLASACPPCSRVCSSLAHCSCKAIWIGWPRHLAIIDLGWTHVNAQQINHLPASVLSLRARPALGMGHAQTADQFSF